MLGNDYKYTQAFKTCRLPPAWGPQPVGQTEVLPREWNPSQSCGIRLCFYPTNARKSSRNVPESCSDKIISASCWETADCLCVCVFERVCKTERERTWPNPSHSHHPPVDVRAAVSFAFLLSIACRNLISPLKMPNANVLSSDLTKQTSWQGQLVSDIFSGGEWIDEMTAVAVLMC